MAASFSSSFFLYFLHFLRSSIVEPAATSTHTPVRPGTRSRSNAEFGRGADHGLLEAAHVPANVAANFAEIQNRIADELSRPVIGDVAAAIGFKKRNAHPAQHLVRGAKIGNFSAAAQRDHVRVLAQQQNVGDGAGFARGGHAPLQLPRRAVFHETEIDDQQLFHGIRTLNS